MPNKIFLQKLGFLPRNNASGIFYKNYKTAEGYCIEVDLEEKKFNFGNKIKSESGTTLNFSQEENWVVFELGIFLLLIPMTYLLLENKKHLLNKLNFLKWFSGISLTIYLSETFLSEVLRIIIAPIIPSWNQTINGCLLFGAFNIIIWLIILFFWRKANFKYSLEYFWVKLFKKLDKESTKMSFEK